MLVYDAWPLRREFGPWKGYKEPIDDTPEALMEAYPTLYHTLGQAREGFENTLGTGREMYQGKIMHVGPSGIPQAFYKGFTTAEEFPAQEEFLNTIRKHPRIQFGISLMEKDYEEAQIRQAREDERSNRMRELINKRLEGQLYSDEDHKAMRVLLDELSGTEPQE